MQNAPHKLIVTPRAKKHLANIFIYLNKKAGAYTASNYIIDIENRIEKLSLFPYIGSMSHEIIPNLRIIGFKKRVTIAFVATKDLVIIHAILYGGQDLEKAFA